MINYGPLSDWRGKYSDTPVVAVGKDQDHITYFSALAFPLKGVITPNRSENLTQKEENYDFTCLALNDYVEELCGKKYHLPVNNEELQKAMIGDKKSLYSTMVPEFKEDIEEFLENLSKEHKKVFLNPYKTSEEIEKFEEIDGIKIIGPSQKSKKELEKKTDMYSLVEKLNIPVIEGEVAENWKEASKIVDKKNWENGAFVSHEKGSGGSGCLHAKNKKDVLEKYAGWEGNFLVLKWLDNIKSCPNNLALVGKNKTLSLATTDQRMDGVEYKGNDYPSKANKNVLKKINKYSKKLGEEIGKKGYRGFLGMDWIVTDENEVYFGEMNMRKNHSTTQNVFMHELFRKEGAPPLPYLEALSVMNEDIEFDEKDYPVPEDIYWGMEVYRIKDWSIIKDNFSNGQKEDNIFLQNSGYTISSQPLENTIAPVVYSISKDDNFHENGNHGSLDVCRIVAVGKDREDMENQIKLGKRELEKNIQKVSKCVQ